MHLSAIQVSSYLSGAVPPEEGSEIERHIDACPACRELLSETVRARYHDLGLAQTQLVSSANALLPVSVGDVIDGRYRVERLVGAGGMGSVWEAHHQALNQRVALKFLMQQFLKDQSALDRFTREARAAVRLVTPHVARVLDLGSLPDGTPFLVMELLVGETIEQRLLREGPFPFRVAVEIMLPVLDALREAHALGIVHRDLKPANVFLARRSSGAEVVKVLDFGVAKSEHPDIEAGLGSTTASTLVGSPTYMAPEQLKPGHPIDGRTDIWAWASTLYQMVTGQPPFLKDDLVELMYAIRSTQHRPLHEIKPELARASEIIEACLSKDMANRPPTAEALKTRIQGLLNETPQLRPPPQPAHARTPKWMLVGIAVIAALTAVGAWFAFRPSPSHTAQVPAPAPERVVPPVAAEPAEAPKTAESPRTGGIVTPLPSVPEPSAEASTARSGERGKGSKKAPPRKEESKSILDERL